MPNLSTNTTAQNQRLLDRLRQGPITSLEAIKSLDIVRPASRVYDLRSEGHKIMTAWSWDRINGADHRVARYVLMPPDPQTRRSPGNAPHAPEAHKEKQHNHLTKAGKEIAGTVVAALIFAASMWSSVFGMTGAFDHMEPGMVLAGVASHE